MARRRRSGRSVALELGCTEPYLSRRLTGAVPFDVTDLIKIADLLEIPVTTFFETPGGRVISPRIETPASPAAAA
jgi:transcriptional regulator with XRE-family HTH domain